MEVSFAELKEKEIINVYDGKKLGRIVDIIFDNENGLVRGVVVPGEKKLFKKSDDIFIPLERLKKIGDDVILVKLQIINSKGYFDYNNSAIMENKRNNNSLANYYGYYKNPQTQDCYQNYKNSKYNRQDVVTNNISQSQSDIKSYVRFRPINNKKYK